MTTEMEYRHCLGAYLLGALEPDEERELETHLRSCQPCHTELLSLGEVVADLAVMATDGELTVPMAVPMAVPPAVPTARPARGRRPVNVNRPVNVRSRSRLVAAAAALAAIAAASGASFALGAASDGTTAIVAAPTPTPTRVPGTRTVEGRSTATGVSGQAVLVPTSWGTSVEITLSGAQQGVGVGAVCLLVIASRSGERATAGSWVVPEHSPTQAGERFKVPSALPIAELAEVLVLTADGTEVLTVHT